jgi:hypothetical protein
MQSLKSRSRQISKIHAAIGKKSERPLVATQQKVDESRNAASIPPRQSAGRSQHRIASGEIVSACDPPRDKKRCGQKLGRRAGPLCQLVQWRTRLAHCATGEINRPAMRCVGRGGCSKD